MKAMILAAGRGTRMRELTEHCAKPLLKLWGRPMIEWQLLKLRKAGFQEVVINTAHCARLFESYRGKDKIAGLKIEISKEGDVFEEALNTKGGIVKALPLLTQGKEPFAVVSGDIVTDYPYERLFEAAQNVRADRVLGHLVLVPNPYFKSSGDMTLENGFVSRAQKQWTYANIAVFSPSLFDNEKAEDVPLFPWLYQFIDQGKISGEIFHGSWANVGTPEDLVRYEAEDNFVLKSLESTEHERD